MAHRSETPGLSRRRLVLARLRIALMLALGVACLFPLHSLRAQETWRGLNVPRYANATDYTVSTDDDEYEMYFRSQDSVQAVFEFYREHLARQGFRVANSKTKKHGFEADMVRGQGGPDNTVELDVKMKNGRHKVEIEFDE